MRVLFRSAGPAFWTGHAPVLFPIVGRLRGDSYRLNGREYSLPQHGFARRSMFRIAAQDDASGLFRLDADEEMQRVYPFDFRLDMAFAVRSEEHTSELQSLMRNAYAVFCLKKKIKII